MNIPERFKGLGFEIFDPRCEYPRRRRPSTDNEKIVWDLLVPFEDCVLYNPIKELAVIADTSSWIDALEEEPCQPLEFYDDDPGFYAISVSREDFARTEGRRSFKSFRSDNIVVGVPALNSLRYDIDVLPAVAESLDDWIAVHYRWDVTCDRAGTKCSWWSLNDRGFGVGLVTEAGYGEFSYASWRSNTLSAAMEFVFFHNGSPIAARRAAAALVDRLLDGFGGRRKDSAQAPPAAVPGGWSAYLLDMECLLVFDDNPNGGVYGEEAMITLVPCSIEEIEESALAAAPSAEVAHRQACDGLEDMLLEWYSYLPVGIWTADAPSLMRTDDYCRYFQGSSSYDEEILLEEFDYALDAVARRLNEGLAVLVRPDMSGKDFLAAVHTAQESRSRGISGCGSVGLSKEASDIAARSRRAPLEPGSSHASLSPAPTAR